MKNAKKLISLLLALTLMLGLSLSVSAAPASSFITTPATGYDSADDVVYVTYSQSGKTVIANWGARGEECVFLSTYAQQYYTSNYDWDILSQVSGGTTQSNAPISELYTQLQTLMKSTHSFYTYYDGSKNVRDYYRYTDCVSSDISKVALLYRGGLVSSVWDSGATWNQEHVWPQSKLGNSQQIGDIMHLRPSNPNENSSRGNKSYGTGYGCYDPGVSVRGDCARMVLYMYVRWGTDSTMWGSGGVMENVSTLLAWMEADPVDTWEMGRNDAVQSVTGVRNVFVDYPEYAWLLFGQEIPSSMNTPSGEAKEGTSNTDPTEPSEPSAPTEPSTPTEPESAHTDFTDAMGQIIRGKVSGEEKFNLLCKAVNAYQQLTEDEKQTVSGLYERLQSELMAYNQDINKVNADSNSANDAIFGFAIAMPLLAVAAYSLLGKKFF